MTTAIDRVDFDFSRILYRATGALQRNWPLLATVTLLFYGLPKLGGTLLGEGADAIPVFGPAFSFTGGIYSFIAVIGYFAIQPMIVYVLVRDQNDDTASFKGCLRIGLNMFLPVLAILLLYGLATLLGFIALIVPGLMLATALLVAMPAAVVERTGVRQAFDRSRWLTRGLRWPVFGLMVLSVLSLALVQGVAGAVHLDDVGFGLFDSAFSTAHALVQDVFAIIGVLAIALIVASIYCELRFLKEDASPAEIASTLD